MPLTVKVLPALTMRRLQRWKLGLAEKAWLPYCLVVSTVPSFAAGREEEIGRSRLFPILCPLLSVLKMRCTAVRQGDLHGKAAARFDPVLRLVK